MVKTCAGCVDVSTCVKDQRAKSLGCKYHLECNALLIREEKSPLNTCVECKNMVCIKDGRICKKVEKLLPKPRGGGHSKEQSHPPDKIEILYHNTIYKRCGSRRMPNITQDGWDED